MPWTNSGADGDFVGFDGFDGIGGDCVDGSGDSTDGFDGTDSIVGFDGGLDGSVVVLLASMALMVASLEWLRLMTEPKRDGKRVERFTHKIRGERADELTHKICEERADELTLKIDGERVQRLTHNISEERADGLTYRKVVIQVLVDGDGSESDGFRWTKTRATSCLRRTQKKSDSSSMLGCVRCE